MEFVISCLNVAVFVNMSALKHLFVFISACNNGQKMIEDDDDDYAYDGDVQADVRERKKRDLNDPNIIPFFTRCMKENTEDLSWEKSSLYVTFCVLQDVWFKATYESVCRYVNDIKLMWYNACLHVICFNRNTTDTADCWKSQIDKLLNHDSVFYAPVKNCIDFYAQG